MTALRFLSCTIYICEYFVTLHFHVYFAIQPQGCNMNKRCIMKALAKTTNRTCGAKKVEGQDKKFRALHAGRVTLPHFQIRSGATGPVPMISSRKS